MISPEKIDSIRSLIPRLASLYEDLDNQQMTLKILINSIYGAFGSVHNYFYLVEVAEAITTQGKNTILSTESFVNNFFRKVWSTSEADDIRKKMGTRLISSEPVGRDISVYIDTDSIYMQYDDVMNTTSWNDHPVWMFHAKAGDDTSMYLSTEGYPTEKDLLDKYPNAVNINKVDPTPRSFAICLYHEFLKDAFAAFFTQMAKDFNAEDGILLFELEVYARTGVWMSKKCYCELLEMKDGVDYLDGKVAARGFDIVKSSTSPFVKKNILSIVNRVLGKDTDKTLSMEEARDVVKELKRRFNLAPPDIFAPVRKVNNLNQYIASDDKVLTVRPHATPEVKGAALYNFLIKKLNLQDKYELIKPGVKVKAVKVTTNIPIKNLKETKAKRVSSKLLSGDDASYEMASTICFPDAIPEELMDSITIDYTANFNKLIISPVERLLKAVYSDAFKV